MKQFVLRFGGLLLAAVVFSAGGARAAESPAAPEVADFRYVPADSAGFATARVAAVVGKVGARQLRGLPSLAACEKKTGVSLANVERCTLVVTADAKDTYVVCHTAKAVDRDRVLKALGDGVKAVKHGTKVYHVNGDGDAVHFAGDRLFLAGPEKAVADAVEKRGPGADSPLGAALRQAPDHDCYAWGLTDVVGPAESGKAVTCCKPACDGGRCSAAKVDALGGLPMPADLEAAEVALDFGEQIVVSVRLHFADEDGARRGAKVLRLGKEALRGVLVMGMAELSALDPDVGLVEAADLKDNAGLLAAAPALLPPLRRFEKAMQAARVETEGKTARSTVTVPVDEKKFRAAVAAGVKLIAASDGFDAGALFPLGTHQRYMVPPAYIGPPPPPPVSAYAPACLPAPPGALSGMGVGAAMGAVMACPPPQAIQPAGATAFVAPSPTVLPPPPPFAVGVSTMPVEIAAQLVARPAAPATALKLAVANVTKEPALLFTEGDGGKLVFKQKVPAGEAVDVETTAGKRWVAVFADNPAGETLVASANKTTWLLRAADRKGAGSPAGPGEVSGARRW